MTFVLPGPSQVTAMGAEYVFAFPAAPSLLSFNLELRTAGGSFFVFFLTKPDLSATLLVVTHQIRGE
jgi:hypothetical protein